MPQTMNRHNSAQPNWLRDAREKAGLSVLQLALASGVNPRTIERIEREGQKPHQATVKVLESALNVEEAA